MSCIDILLVLDTVTSVGAFPSCSFRHVMNPDEEQQRAMIMNSLKKSPAFAVQINLIPGVFQVGAI